jgi:PIN domain nuclease of toxin-antitoxin system
LRLLVDTHAALWLLAKDERLPPTAREMIYDRGVDCFLSAASVWEVAIKRRLGKLRASAAFHIDLERHDIRGLPIYDRHAALVADLPLHHKDPFDRLIVAQAMVEKLSILSADATLRAYDVPVLW